jgi:thioredoxin 1
VLRFTTVNFEDEVIKSDLPVLVEFVASWCPPCKMMEPVVKEIAEEYKDKVKVGKLNVDQNKRIASKYEVKGVPTFMLFVSGKLERRLVGALSKEQLKEFLAEVELIKAEHSI